MSQTTTNDNFDKIMDELEALSPATLDNIMAMAPWQGSPPGSLAIPTVPITDEDGFTANNALLSDTNYEHFADIQQMSWNMFKSNPFVFTTVLDVTGRLTGHGFSQNNAYIKANDVMLDVWEDPRNNLVMHFGKYIARAIIQGELFLCLTLHKNGFVEVDFISPSIICGFDDGSGILTAPGKPMFPLMYRIKTKDPMGEKFIPSVNLAYYPELWSTALKDKTVMAGKDNIVGADNNPAFKELNNHKMYIVQWDQGFVTKRNVGRVRVTLEWLEHYTNIKKWELDHKKSSGAYLWVIEIEDRQAFRLWLAMTEEQRKETGLMQKKVPGGTLMLPPGFKLNCHNPKLSSITNQDTDILNMISAGLNTPEDVMTGSSSGTTYSGAKLSRGPVADRIQDQTINLERWLIFSFWRSIFCLNNKVTGLPLKYKEKKAYKFEGKKPKFRSVQTEIHKLVSINFPLTEMGDIESKAKSMLGVQHGPITETLGVSKSDVAGSLGFPDYNETRLKTATEDETYPELPLSFELNAAASMPTQQTEKPGTVPAAPKKDTETVPAKKTNDA